MSKLKVVLIDDEPDSLALLHLQLQRHCPSIYQITSFNSPVNALENIPLLKPDLVFVDVEMPNMNGFELLERLSPLSFKVVFVTAFNQYAIRAFRFNALDYLLKPADAAELQEAVRKAESQHQPVSTQLSLAGEQVKGVRATRMAVVGQSGTTFIELKDIVYVEASNNYSKIMLNDASVHLLSKTLKDVQELLEESHFHRIHRQYLVNLNCVRHFNRNEGLLTMDSKLQLPIVRNQYERFLEKYHRL
jgi:two-component system LytT family response regulator